MSLILDGTNGISDIDGSAATPAIRGTDANTGIFFPAADTIAFSEGGTEVARFDSSGRLGIGTTSPSEKLQLEGSGSQYLRVKTTTTNADMYLGITSTGAGYVGTGGADPVAFHTGGSERMRIASNGYVSIGTTTTAGDGKLSVEASGGGSSEVNISLTSGTGNKECILNFGDNLTTAGRYKGRIFYQLDNSVMGFWTNTTERMRIDSSGNLLVGTTSNLAGPPKVSIAFDQSLTYGITLKNTNAGNATNYLYFINSANGAAGSVTQTGATTVSYTTSSDYRLKENIAPITGALDKVAQLKPVTYKWKIDGSDGQGFIAHEIQAIVPDCVVGEKDAVEIVDELDENGKVIGTKEVPKYQGIDTSFLVATLTAAIQEQQTIITSLTARIAALEAAP
jgi:hypothetical protein